MDSGRGFVLHTPIGGWEATPAVSDSIGVTSSRDILLSMAERGEPERAIVALGYAGWEPGQLEQELVENAWLSTPASRELVLDTPFEQTWQAAAARIGVDMSLITTQAGHS